MKKLIYLQLLIGTFVFVSCKTSQVANSNTSYNSEAVQLSDSRGVPDIEKINDPILKERVEKIRASLKQNPPVLALAENTNDEQKTAQELALKDERFLRETLDEKTKEPLFNEIFGIYPLRESDMAGPAAACRSSQNTKCYRVEMYNFAKNLTMNAVADVTNKKIIVVTRFPDAQPDIPEHLTKLAVHISSAAPDVISALGRNPEEKDALMANTKTSLSRTRCERSQHLCVAPTYIKDDKALWAIVDLTDLALVGTRWTQVGYAAPASMGDWAISEKSLQNEVLTKRFCETTNHLDKNGWSFDYILTSSDGMRISDVKFNGRLLIKDAKLVDWHVSYSRTDNFGYSDAVGCPVFSQAAVVAVEGPRTNTIDVDGKDTGFEFRQDFWSEGYPTPCNYYYTQAFKFFNDGSFRFAVASQGRGCGNDGMYRPVLRVSLADDLNNFAEWNGAVWQPWSAEQWKLQDESTAYTSEGFQYRVTGADGKGFYLEPGRGQFGDGGRGDNAFLYVTRGHADKDEGDSDMTTIGPCCNTDYHQGPEKFIEPAAEPIANAPLVLWYVPQLKNDDRPNQKYCWAESVLDDGIYRVKQYPCYAGPMLRPVN